MHAHTDTHTRTNTTYAPYLYVTFSIEFPSIVQSFINAEDMIVLTHLLTHAHLFNKCYLCVLHLPTLVLCTYIPFHHGSFCASYLEGSLLPLL